MKIKFDKINDNGSSLVMCNNVEPKFKVSINNDELLEAIWEHIKQMKREGGVAFFLVWNFAQEYIHDHN
jgi:hypothetical protein